MREVHYKFSLIHSQPNRRRLIYTDIIIYVFTCYLVKCRFPLLCFTAAEMECGVEIETIEFRLGINFLYLKCRTPKVTFDEMKLMVTMHYYAT